ncbi:MAG TPA: hypothetical protein PK156_45915, partial [Polyangium sp.]|nr:hypothetical protein [Polyangium sp.]
MRAFAFSSLVGGLFLFLGIASCGEYPVHWYSLCHDDDGHEVPCCTKWPNAQPCPDDAGADGDVDGGTTDASDDGETDAGADDGGPPASECPGQCIPTIGGGFDLFPSYVWIGPESEAPPPGLSGMSWESSLDVMFAEPNCPACSCVAPTNPVDGCALPAVWSVESNVCQDPSSSIATSFDPPMNWAGSCTSENPIMGGLVCDG